MCADCRPQMSASEMHHQSQQSPFQSNNAEEKRLKFQRTVAQNPRLQSPLVISLCSQHVPAAMEEFIYRYEAFIPGRNDLRIERALPWRVPSLAGHQRLAHLSSPTVLRINEFTDLDLFCSKSRWQARP